MWANSVWGLASLAVACFLAWLTVPDPTVRVWLLAGTVVLGALSIIVLVWPLIKSRARVEPIHIIIFGLLIAFGGVGWQWFRGYAGPVLPDDNPPLVSGTSSLIANPVIEQGYAATVLQLIGTYSRAGRNVQYVVDAAIDSQTRGENIRPPFPYAVSEE